MNFLKSLLRVIKPKNDQIAIADSSRLEHKIAEMARALNVATFSLGSKPEISDKVDIVLRGELGQKFARTGLLDISLMPENKYILFACAKPVRSEAMPFFGGHLLLKKRTLDDVTTIDMKALNIAQIEKNGLFSMFVNRQSMASLTKDMEDKCKCKPRPAMCPAKCAIDFNYPIC